MYKEGFHRLSTDDQREILRQLIDNKTEVIGSGGGRIVFVHPTDKSKVIKVALGAGGVVQNLNEQRVYDGYGDSGYLADIHGYSDYMEIMDRVDDCIGDVHDYFSMKSWEAEEADQDEIEAEEQEAWDLVSWLDDITGSTPDNEQIGYLNGDLVAYDYGYDPDYETHTQVSELRDIDFDLYQYLEGMIRVVDDEITMEQLEFAILDEWNCDEEEEDIE